MAKIAIEAEELQAIKQNTANISLLLAALVKRFGSRDDSDDEPSFVTTLTQDEVDEIENWALMFGNLPVGSFNGSTAYEYWVRAIPPKADE